MKDKGRLARVDIGLDPEGIDSIFVDPDDGTLGLTDIQSYAPGTVRGVVINRTPADGMQVFRTESNGAARPILDAPVTATRRWLDGRADLYQFADPDPRRSLSSLYIVRGLIGGTAGASSPLTVSGSPAATPFTDIRYTALRNGILPSSGAPPPAESTFVMRWDPVPGAVRYWIHVFEYQTGFLGLRDRILRGAPSPLQTYGARDIFIASLPASITTYKMGDPPATIYTFRTPHMRVDYFVRISAVDGSGRMIGMTTGPTIRETHDLLQIADINDYIADFTDPEVANQSPPVYLLFSRGAVKVNPGAPN
jgi:hypothetical protein